MASILPTGPTSTSYHLIVGPRAGQPVASLTVTLQPQAEDTKSVVVGRTLRTRTLCFTPFCLRTLRPARGARWKTAVLRRRRAITLGASTSAWATVRSDSSATRSTLVTRMTICGPLFTTSLDRKTTAVDLFTASGARWAPRLAAKPLVSSN